MFHAAEALIIERSGKIAKTHSGVRSELARLLEDRATEDRAMLTLLTHAYKFKQVSDYGVGQATVIETSQAAQAIVDADRFISWIAGVIGDEE